MLIEFGKNTSSETWLRVTESTDWFHGAESFLSS
jgi:hypothetical protein